jgi:hypothetical protein
MMKQTWTAFGTIGALAVMMAGCGMGKATPPPPVAVSSVTEKPGQVVEQQVVSIAAKVVKVDQKARVVTLRKADGEVVDVQVGDEVRNLPQVKKGDDVIATYYESIALTVRKPGEATPGVETADTVGRAKPGEKPGGIAATQTTVTATVVGLNMSKGTVTLKGPRGKTVTVTARDPKCLEHVKVGDLIEAVYTEAVMISVEKPVKKKK